MQAFRDRCFHVSAFLAPFTNPKDVAHAWEGKRYVDPLARSKPLKHPTIVSEILTDIVTEVLFKEVPIKDAGYAHIFHILSIGLRVFKPSQLADLHICSDQGKQNTKCTKREEVGEQISWLCGNPRQFEAKILGCGRCQVPGRRKGMPQFGKHLPIRTNSTKFYSILQFLWPR